MRIPLLLEARRLSTGRREGVNVRIPLLPERLDTGAWDRRNRRVLLALGALLVAAAALGFARPDLSMNSTRTPYNLFHLTAGIIGFALVVLDLRRIIPAYTLAFGLIDLYQAVAGLADFFPARLFGLRPADHAVHVVLGGLLAVLGALGLRAARARPSAG